MMKLTNFFNLNLEYRPSTNPAMEKSIKHIRSFLMAKTYDFVMRRTEQRCLHQWRTELLSKARGDLLEIGAGTGLNLPHYPASVTGIILSEPDLQMRKQLQVRINKANRQVNTAPWTAEAIAMPDASFDTIVSTLVLCSVASLDASLRESYRLLRPDGTLLFLEHVISDRPPILAWQRRIEPFWSFCAGDCRLTRDTAAAIRSAGFYIEQLTESTMAGAPVFVNRTIRGLARKPAP